MTRWLLIGVKAALLGAILVLGWLGIQPFASGMHPAFWCVAVLLLDAVLRTRSGSALFAGGIGSLAALGLASMAYWSFFELLNLRLRNWYLVNLPSPLPLRLGGELLTAATMLPIVFVTAELLGAFGFFAGRPVPPLVLSSGRLHAFTAAGAMCVLLPLLLPELLFPLVWLAPFLLLEPQLKRWGVPCLLLDFETGQTRRLVLLAWAGLACGVAWQLVNVVARAGWYFSLSGIQEPQLFRLPVLGLVAFIPLAWSGYSTWVFFDTLRGGNGFRLTEWPEEAELRRAQAKKGGLSVVAWLAVLGLIGGGAFALQRNAAASLAASLDDVPSAAPVMETLDEFGFDDPFALAKVHGYRGATLAIEKGVPLGKLGAAIDESALLTVAGIGVENARLLRLTGVEDVDALARANPVPLWTRLRYTNGMKKVLPRHPTLGQVKNWIHEARRFIAP